MFWDGLETGLKSTINYATVWIPCGVQVISVYPNTQDFSQRAPVSFFIWSSGALCFEFRQGKVSGYWTLRYPFQSFFIIRPVMTLFITLQRTKRLFLLTDSFSKYVLTKLGRILIKFEVLMRRKSQIEVIESTCTEISFILRSRFGEVCSCCR